MARREQQTATNSDTMTRTCMRPPSRPISSYAFVGVASALLVAGEVVLGVVGFGLAALRSFTRVALPTRSRR